MAAASRASTPLVATRWVGLFALTRAVAVLLAVGLLVVHRVTAHDVLLASVVLAYGATTIGAALRFPAVFRRPVAWSVDIVVALGLILASDDWRSPFYLLALTTLAAPSVVLPFRRALLVGAAFTVAFVVVAVFTGLDLGTLRSSIRLETLATHLALPGVVTLGLAYAADVLRRLQRERGRTERLAVEAERRRIAWELHDSAKQRLHAAHLVLSVLPPSETLERGLEHLRGATADMDTSIAELRSPLGGRPLEAVLADRAMELDLLAGETEVSVHGSAPPLPPSAVAHAYRILAEAMSNAVQHAEARRVEVRLSTEGGTLHASVEDDGRGLPARLRPGANGLLNMRSRAFAIGAQLTVEPASESGGTRVRLLVPPLTTEGAP